jgi:hypothetical protein
MLIRIHNFVEETMQTLLRRTSHSPAFSRYSMFEREAGAKQEVHPFSMLLSELPARFQP